MELTCARSILQEGVAAVQNVVGAKISNPIVETILVEAKDDTLFLTATNLSLSVRFQADAMVGKPGKVAVPAKFFSSMVSDLLAEEVRISLDGQDINVVNGRSKFRLHTLAAEEFPPFIVLVEGLQLTLPTERLKTLIQRTVFACSMEKSRFELDGVKVDVEGENILRFVATDGRRLCKCEATDIPVVQGFSALVPSRTFRETLRILPPDTQAQVTVGEGKIMIQAGPMTMVSTLLSDNFPPYQEIIPDASDCVVEVERNALLHAVRSAGVVASDKTSLVRVEFKGEEMRVHAEHAQVGDADITVGISYDGKPMTVGYQSHFLVDVLKVLEGEKISLSLTDSRSPALLKQVGDESFLYVLMPVRLSEEEERLVNQDVDDDIDDDDDVMDDE